MGIRLKRMAVASLTFLSLAIGFAGCATDDEKPQDQDIVSSDMNEDVMSATLDDDVNSSTDASQSDIFVDEPSNSELFGDEGTTATAMDDDLAAADFSEPAPDMGMTTEPAAAPQTTTVDLSETAVLFGYNKASLTSAARTMLDDLASRLRSNPQSKLTVTGHADERGTFDYNYELGLQRAQAAKDYLVSKGIEAFRITADSFGEQNPVAEGHNEAAWRQNRRAGFSLSEPEMSAFAN